MDGNRVSTRRERLRALARQLLGPLAAGVSAGERGGHERRVAPTEATAQPTPMAHLAEADAPERDHRASRRRATARVDA